MPKPFQKTKSAFSKHQVFAILILIALIGLAIFVYWPGLNGPFLFDDFPNLEPLGAYNAVDNFESFKLFVLNGFAGPTGRPLSLLSFLINDNTWPSDPWGFKYTNLLLHVLNGLLLFWLTYRLLLAYLPAQRLREAAWLALLAAGLWLIHPLHISTVLYVVQRMTELSALFVLLGLLGYVVARSQLERTPGRALILMTGAIGLGTLAATFSKENGALLPVFALVIEMTVFAGQKAPRWLNLWRAVVLGLPTLAILGYLARPLWRNTGEVISNRGFTLIERLFTEARIVTEYLQHLFLPTPISRGLYADAYPLSTGWLSPPETAMAIGLLGLLFGLALWLRQRLPLLSLAILFFFAGHLLESTTISLELYFEHRNYLPAVFLFLPVAAGLVGLYRRMPGMMPGVTVLLFAILLSITGLRATHWGKPNQLFLLWAQESPTSARAQVGAAQALIEAGQPKLALNHLRSVNNRLDESLFVALQYTFYLERFDLLKPQHIEALKTAVATRAINSDSLAGLRRLAEYAASGKSQRLSIADMHTILAAFETNPHYTHSRHAKRLTAYLQGLLFLKQSKSAQALMKFRLSLQRHTDVERGMQQVALLASHGYFSQALMHLADAEKVLARQPDRSLKQKRAFYEQEIERIRRLLREETERE